MKLLRGLKNKEGGETMGDDLKKILQLVEEGTITAQEAERLIGAIRENEEQNKSTEDTGRKNKFLRIRVLEEGKSKVNVNIPLSLVDITAKVGTKFIPYDDIPNGEELKDIDWKEILDAIKKGASGKLVDIQDGDDVVEIYVE